MTAKRPPPIPQPIPMPWPSWVFPILAILYFAGATALGLGDAESLASGGLVYAVLLIIILLGAVFAAVHHAEVIAVKTGEPYGTLVLTVSVTVIEVALITSVILSDESGAATIARDTVFAVVMIVCGGLVGLCIFLGGILNHEQSFRVRGAAAYLAVLLPLCMLSLILPNYTHSSPGPMYARPQLIFVSIVTLALYAVFLYIQTVSHRDYFIMRGSWDSVSSNGTFDSTAGLAPEETPKGHSHVMPTQREVLVSAGLLLLALTGVVLLAKKFANVAEAATTAIGAPQAAVGVIVAVLILLPEGVAAVQAAWRDELQKSLNLALGSSLATIGLTIPAVAVVAIAFDRPLVLGLEPKDSLMLFIVLAVSMLTFGTGGRTNMLFGFVHLVVFATYLFLVFVP